MKIKFIVLVAFLTSINTFSQKKWDLKECVDEALAKNISIQQNRLSLELAKKDVEIAKGNFLPSLSANTGGNLNFGTGFDPRSQNRINTTFFGGSVNLSSGVTVFNGYRNTNTYKQAQLGVETSIFDLKKIENDISLFVVNGYLNILFAKENLNAARVQYVISKKQIEAAQSRFDSGVIPRGDLLNTQATAATDLQTVVTQENALDLALLNLAQLLQISFEDFDVAPINVGTPSANLFYKNSSNVYDKSLEAMPEIGRAKIAIESAGLSIDISKAAFLPLVTASAALSTNYGFNLNPPDGFPNAGFSNQLNENLGYGGVQKIAYRYAIKNDFDFVIMLHGDGQYSPEKLPDVIENLISSGADGVFGSRLIKQKDALKGGMPFYKFVGNRVLTFIQNLILGTNFSEFHSGYRSYKVNALRKINFERNTNDFHFDTEILIQLFLINSKIKEISIPTFYGDEICHVNGMKYAFNIIKTTSIAALQKSFDLKFSKKYRKNNQMIKFYKNQTIDRLLVEAKKRN